MWLISGTMDANKLFERNVTLGGPNPATSFHFLWHVRIHIGIASSVHEGICKLKAIPWSESLVLVITILQITNLLTFDMLGSKTLIIVLLVFFIKLDVESCRALHAVYVIFNTTVMWFFPAYWGNKGGDQTSAARAVILVASQVQFY